MVGECHENKLFQYIRLFFNCIIYRVCRIKWNERISYRSWQRHRDFSLSPVKCRCFACAIFLWLLHNCDNVAFYFLMHKHLAKFIGMRTGVVRFTPNIYRTNERTNEPLLRTLQYNLFVRVSLVQCAVVASKPNMNSSITSHSMIGFDLFIHFWTGRIKSTSLP